jgi:MoCo/4Fe-4S cofactor protein with predicted Tat translocation signal
MSDTQKPLNKKEFWKSLKEYNGDPEALKAKENEFMNGVTDDFDPSKLRDYREENF